jgi:hypothetical protein
MEGTMAEDFLREVLQAMTPAVQHLLSPEATEVLVKLSATPKGRRYCGCSAGNLA